MPSHVPAPVASPAWPADHAAYVRSKMQQGWDAPEHVDALMAIAPVLDPLEHGLTIGEIEGVEAAWQYVDDGCYAWTGGLLVRKVGGGKAFIGGFLENWQFNRKSDILRVMHLPAVATADSLPSDMQRCSAVWDRQPFEVNEFLRRVRAPANEA